VGGERAVKNYCLPPDEGQRAGVPKLGRVRNRPFLAQKRNSDGIKMSLPLGLTREEIKSMSNSKLGPKRS